MRIGSDGASVKGEVARRALLKKLKDKGSSGASTYSSSFTVEVSFSTSRVVSSRMGKGYGKEKEN